MELNKKIIIGTAQFGSNYGVTNKTGELSFSKIKKIVYESSKQNINFFDTSPTYGNAENKLGKSYIEIIWFKNLFVSLLSNTKSTSSVSTFRALLYLSLFIKVSLLFSQENI